MNERDARSAAGACARCVDGDDGCVGGARGVGGGVQTGRMADDRADAYWRTRTGAPRSRGVLAPAAGDPAIGAAGSPIGMTRHAPAPALAALVRHYWIPRWTLPPGRSVTQRVLEYPSANLVVEGGEAAVWGPSPGLGSRTLTGSGWAFGVLLQPGVAPLLLGLPARALVGAERGVPLADVPGADDALPRVAAATAAGDEAGAVAAFEHWFGGLGLTPDDDALTVRRLVERAEHDRGLTRVAQLAESEGLGIRRLERLVREQLGLTPRWLIRRYRLQEAAERLAGEGSPPLAELAAELGYADQAHFTREFRTVIGETPGGYARAARTAR
ncbi:helix-turn-helix domain-containing protein [Agromyces mediolanus]|uniref:AraC family transcriptional regulator n=1 Tax=Agromyces mediolanus TaxID=41986 RepID=UPI00383291CE